MHDIVKLKRGIEREIEEIVQWCREHGCDVDFGVFRDACYNVAARAACMQGMRLPLAVTPDSGVLALDFACACVGLFVPHRLYESRLPGARQFREALGDMEQQFSERVG